jgi:hypothetical protein
VDPVLIDRRSGPITETERLGSTDTLAFYLQCAGPWAQSRTLADYSMCAWAIALTGSIFTTNIASRVQALFASTLGHPSMRAFSQLLDDLVYTRSRSTKLKLIGEYLR